MNNEYKYRRWAWGALIGLAIVIVVAGIIMASSASTPKPKSDGNVRTVADTSKTEKKDNNEKTTKKTETDDQTKKNDKKTETKSEPTTTTTNDTKNTTSEKQGNSGSVKTTSNMPKTGPEDGILPIAAAAVIAYLFAYNSKLFKKNA